MQLRVSNMRAPYGRSFWSEPLQLDSLGGAAIVSVPCPGHSPSYAQPDARAAYALSVTASQVRQIFKAYSTGVGYLVYSPCRHCIVSSQNYTVPQAEACSCSSLYQVLHHCITFPEQASNRQFLAWPSQKVLFHPALMMEQMC